MGADDMRETSIPSPRKSIAFIARVQSDGYIESLVIPISISSSAAVVSSCLFTLPHRSIYLERHLVQIVLMVFFATVKVRRWFHGDKVTHCAHSLDCQFR